MIRRETDYAIRTVLCLVQDGTEKTVPVSTAELAARAGVPYRFLRKIVSKLVAAGFVRSRRGKGGGLQLACDPNELSLLHILELMDPDAVNLNRCMTDTPPVCRRSAYCGIRQALFGVQQNLCRDLASVTLEQIARLDQGAEQQDSART